jgi:hypothetical protein
MFHILKRNSSFLFCASGSIEHIQHCITDVVDGDGLDIASLLGRGPWHFEIKGFSSGRPDNFSRSKTCAIPNDHPNSMLYMQQGRAFWKNLMQLKHTYHPYFES